MFSRNQKWYKSLRTKTLAAERKASHLTATIESHFSDFRNAQIKYGIAQDDIYNMDETGFRIGCLGSQIVITHLNTKAVYLSVPDNRKMVTSVECISGGGFAIAPMIILAGSVLMKKHFDNHINDDVLFSISDSGYINSYLCIEWLRHFNKQTNSKRKGKYRMIIFDGHESHLTDEFTYYCWEHNIIPF